ELVNDEWISLKEAAALLQISYSGILRLRGEIDPLTNKPYLISWQPRPFTVRISLASLQSYHKATRDDPEFWEKRRPQPPPVRPAPNLFKGLPRPKVRKVI